MSLTAAHAPQSLSVCKQPGWKKFGFQFPISFRKQPKLRPDPLKLVDSTMFFYQPLPLMTKKYSSPSVLWGTRIHGCSASWGTRWCCPESRSHRRGMVAPCPQGCYPTDLCSFLRRRSRRFDPDRPEPSEVVATGLLGGASQQS